MDVTESQRLPTLWVMNNKHIPRWLEKEQKTVEAMIGIFCCAHHGAGKKVLCPACMDLLDYAEERLRRCPFGRDKGPCSKCRIHCYKPDMRERITRVMHYSGPKMLRKHPFLSINHMLKAKGIRRNNEDSRA